jgi:hypothetical protein
MQGILFKPDVWKAKQAVLAKYGEAQTRRMSGLDEINQKPDEWEIYPHKHLNNVWGFFNHNTLGTSFTEWKLLKPRYHPGEIVYVKEAYYVQPELWAVNHDPQPIHYAQDTDSHEVEDYVKKSPLFMPEWAARYHLKIISAEPELFKIVAMTKTDIEAEGGEPSLKLLQEYDGKWLWKYVIREEK